MKFQRKKERKTFGWLEWENEIPKEERIFKLIKKERKKERKKEQNIIRLKKIEVS